MFKIIKYFLLTFLLVIVFSINLYALDSQAIQSNQIDQEGGTLIILECISPNLTDEEVGKNAKIVKNCINELGISESKVRRLGSRRILIELLPTDYVTRNNLIDLINKYFQVQPMTIEMLGPAIEIESTSEISIKKEETQTKPKILVESSLYTFEYEMPVTTKHKHIYLPVTVKGPSDELSLMLTNPKEETDIIFISKRSLIDNIETVNLDFGEYPFSEGPYILTVKTVTPEEVIFKAELWYTVPSPEDIQLTCGEVTLKYNWDNFYNAHAYDVIEYLLCFKNNADLPFFVDNIGLEFSLPGRKISLVKDKTNERKKTCTAWHISIPSGESDIHPKYHWPGFCHIIYKDGPRDGISAVTKLYIDDDKLFLTYPMKIKME